MLALKREAILFLTVTCLLIASNVQADRENNVSYLTRRSDPEERMPDVSETAKKEIEAFRAARARSEREDQIQIAKELELLKEKIKAEGATPQEANRLTELEARKLIRYRHAYNWEGKD